MRDQAKAAKRYLISGRVQGVGFRFFAQRVAHELGIVGYVMNRPDGSVEAYAVGTEASLAELKRRLAEGPRMSRVNRIMESDEAVDQHCVQFVIH